jgi:hypothetical protein
MVHSFLALACGVWGLSSIFTIDYIPGRAFFETKKSREFWLASMGRRHPKGQPPPALKRCASTRRLAPALSL